MSFFEIIERAAEQAGLKMERTADHYLRCRFELDGDRRQVVNLSPVGGLGGLSVIRISTPVLELPDDQIPPSVAEGLLRENGRMKIGAFSIEDVDGHKILALRHNMILETLDPEELLVVAGSLAVTADQWEQRLSGQDRF